MVSEVGDFLTVGIDEKSAEIFVRKDGKLHVAWKFGDYILFFEDIPENYPSCYLKISTMDAYVHIVRKTDWLYEEIKEIVEKWRV